jgi:hypothetical protein
MWRATIGRVGHVTAMLMVGCAGIEEPEMEHFTNDYLRGDTVPLHGESITYEQIGTIAEGTPILLAMRDDTCGRMIVDAAFLQFDIRSTPCPEVCRIHRATILHDRARSLPYHALMRGMDYERIAQSPFLNAEVHVVIRGQRVVIPFWKIDVIRRAEPVAPDRR